MKGVTFLKVFSKNKEFMIISKANVLHELTTYAQSLTNTELDKLTILFQDNVSCFSPDDADLLDKVAAAVRFKDPELAEKIDHVASSLRSERTRLENFPSELITIIASFLPGRDQQSLRKICGSIRKSLLDSEIMTSILDSKLSKTNRNDNLLSFLQKYGHLIKKLDLNKFYGAYDNEFLKKIIQECPNLEQFAIKCPYGLFGYYSNSNLSDGFLEQLKELKFLRDLVLRDFEINANTLTGLKDLGSLTSLSLEGGSLKSDGFKPLQEAVLLKSLSLCDLEESTETFTKEISYLGGMTSLESLKISKPGVKVNVADEGFELICEIITLRYLCLYSAKITDSALHHLLGLEFLEHLDLSYCQNITEEGLKTIVKSAPGLKELTLLSCDKIKGGGGCYNFGK